MATPSLISDLLLHPLNFSTLTGPILTSIQHLTTALTLITAVQTNDTPTLGLLTELQPLVNGFKRFVKRSDQKETGRVGDKEEAKNEKDKAAAAAAAAANCADGDNEDVFNIEDGTEFLTAEDNVVLDKINAAFLKQSRNPRSVKPNFQKVFSEMDQSGDGKLDYDELRAALQSINIELTDEEMDTLMKRLDIDGDGDVNYMEFIRFVKVSRADAKPDDAHAGYQGQDMAVDEGDKLVLISRPLGGWLGGGPLSFVRTSLCPCLWAHTAFVLCRCKGTLTERASQRPRSWRKR